MINRENDFCWLKAMRWAMKEDKFTKNSYNVNVEWSMVN
jgi:hypothetical protein